jgi:hypothetical protein
VDALEYSLDCRDLRSSFQVGKLLSCDGRLDLKNRRVFGIACNRMDLVVHCTETYRQGLRVAARRAVVAWSICGLRLGVVKDVRVLIGKLIWHLGEQSNYEWPEQETSAKCVLS